MAVDVERVGRGDGQPRSRQHLAIGNFNSRLCSAELGPKIGHVEARWRVANERGEDWVLTNERADVYLSIFYPFVLPLVEKIRSVVDPHEVGDVYVDVQKGEIHSRLGNNHTV